MPGRPETLATDRLDGASGRSPPARWSIGPVGGAEETRKSTLERSTVGSGGSGRLWVRGQGFKLTGCVDAVDGQSFLPEVSGPRARGKGCHVRRVACTAQSAEPAISAARGETPPGRGRISHPARRAGRDRAGARPAQLGRAETADLRRERAGKPRPDPAALADLPVLWRRPVRLDRPGR